MSQADARGRRGSRTTTRLFNDRTLANYDPTIAHPLLVVYAAAGNYRYETEALTDLTTEATARGFLDRRWGVIETQSRFSRKGDK